MFAKRNLREVTPGEEIAAEDYNDLVREVKRLQLIEGPGIHVDQSEVGQVVKVIPYSGLLAAYTPAGGIPAATFDASTPPVITAGSASCTIGVFTSGTWKDTGVTRTVYNAVGTAVAASKWVLVIPSGDGSVHCIVEPCP